MCKIFLYLEKKEEEEDEKEEFEEERSHEEKTSVKVHAMVSVFQFIMKQSYICALISMMVCTRSHSTGAEKCAPGPLAGSLADLSGAAGRS